MEPVGTFHDCIEVKVGGVGLGYCRVGAVVDDLGGAHGGTGLAVVDTDAVAATGDVVGVYAVAAQGVEGCLADFVLGQFRYEIGFVAVVGAGNSDVGLAAAPDYVERIDLDETVATGR